MTLDAYQRLSKRTMNGKISNEETKLHALHGLAAEVGEIHSIYQKQYQGHLIDRNHLVEEIGDLMWFVAELCTSIGESLEDVCSANVNKLMKRYPNGFSEERSVNR